MMNWADLPEELLSLILSNLLFAKERHSFRQVCKAWNEAAKFSPFGCLMFYQRSIRAWKFFQHKGFFSMDLPDEKHLDGADIRCAKHGWMLMSKPDLTMFFYHPFNNETIHLPKPDSKYRVVCFSHPPTSRDCFVVGATTEKRPEGVKIGVLRPRWGENEWTSCVYHSKSRFRLSVCTPVLRQQRLVHFLDVDGNIGVFDVGCRSGSPDDSWTVQTECLLDAAPQLLGKIVQHFLVDEQEVLLSVLVAHDERQVNVFGMLLSGPTRKWAPVEDLGDKALFVSRRACFAVTAPQRSMANRIYFAKLHGYDDDEDLVYYCLGTRRYHSCNGDYSSKDSFRCRDLSFATWITAPPVFQSEKRKIRNKTMKPLW